ncbi:MAG: C1q-like domain-containing protein, partial [Planctomycetota bacterium]
MNRQSIAFLILGALLLVSLAGGYPSSPFRAMLGPVTTPFEFQAGTPVRASEMNENFLAHEVAINDNATRITDLEGTQFSVPAFRAVVSAPTTGTSTGTVVCDQEVLDDGGGYNPATGVFTAPRAGVYHLSFLTSGARVGIANIAMVKNGTDTLGAMQIIINRAGS